MWRVTCHKRTVHNQGSQLSTKSPISAKNEIGIPWGKKSVREERERKKRKWGLGMHFPQKGHNSL